jgi:choline dehydrogenase-like flavoprotein
MAASMLRGYLFGTGPATIVPGGLHAFVKTQQSLAVPDLEFMFRQTPDDARLWAPLVRSPYRDGFAVRAALLHPESRGTVRLRSTNPFDAPRIALNLLAARRDVETLLAGIRLAREIASQRALDTFRGAEIGPGPDVQDDASLTDWIRRTVVTVLHPSCSCPMGVRADSVLDPNLRARD